MRINDLIEFKESLTALNQSEVFGPYTAGLNKLYDSQVDSFFIKEASELSDKLKGTLKKYFPHLAPQEEEEWPTEEIPNPQQPAMEGQEQPGGFEESQEESPGGVALPNKGYTPYRGLGEQAEYEGLEDKFKNDISEPYLAFQKFVRKVNSSPGGYDPSFVQQLNEGWKQIKSAIYQYFTKPKKNLQNTIQGLPEPTRKYPQEQEDFIASVYGKSLI